MEKDTNDLKINNNQLEDLKEEKTPDVTSELDIYYDELEDVLEDLEQTSDFSKDFYKHYTSGERTIYQKDITELKIFDDEWIRNLEAYFPSIDKIVNNPKSNIKYEDEIVLIEKAKKINARSIQHLASHTQFVKSVERNGDVVPKKILTNYTEQDYAIYENRFIKTLIDRLYVFVTNRYNIIKENVDSFGKNHVNIKSEFPFKNTDVSVNIDVVVKKTLNNSNNRKNKELLKRVEELNKLTLSFRNSPLYRLLKDSPKINPPIIQTNLILKNPDFKNCYTLWLFLDKYNALAFDLNVSEKNKKITKRIENAYNRAVFMSYLATEANEKVRKGKDGNEEEVLVKKSLKRTNKNDSDLIKRPEALEIEDNSINEFYLNQYKAMFKKSIDEFKKSASTDEVALKQAIRMVNNISNALYQSFFELEEDDIFSKLVKDSDPRVDYSEAKKKANIAKIIREVKEVDYNNAIRLEKKVINDMSKASTRLIKEIKGKIEFEEEEKLKAELQKELDTYIEAKKSNKTKTVTLAGKKVKVTKAKTNSKDQVRTINEKLKIKLKEIEATERKRSKDRIKVLKEEHKKRVNEIINIENEKSKKIIQKTLEEKNKIKAQNKLAIEKAKAKVKNETKVLENIVKSKLKDKEIKVKNDIKNKTNEKLALIKQDNKLESDK